MSRYPLGYLLLSPDRRHVWGGNGRLLPLARLPGVPPLWEDRLDALRAVLGVVLKPERCWAP